MTTITLDKPGSFRVGDTPAPSDVPPDHALVRVARVLQDRMAAPGLARR